MHPGDRRGGSSAAQDSAKERQTAECLIIAGDP